MHHVCPCNPHVRPAAKPLVVSSFEYPQGTLVRRSKQSLTYAKTEYKVQAYLQGFTGLGPEGPEKNGLVMKPGGCVKAASCAAPAVELEPFLNPAHHGSYKWAVSS